MHGEEKKPVADDFRFDGAEDPFLLRLDGLVEPEKQRDANTGRDDVEPQAAGNETQRRRDEQISQQPSYDRSRHHRQTEHER